jgi:hypothetical protein
MLAEEGRRSHGALEGGDAADFKPIKWQDTSIDTYPGSAVGPPSFFDSGLDSCVDSDFEADSGDDDLLDPTLEEKVDDDAVAGLDRFFASLRASMRTNGLLGGLESSANLANRGNRLNGSNGAASPAAALHEQTSAAVSGPPEPAAAAPGEVSGERWRERALVWRERALSAETLAKALERHVQDLRTNLEDLRSSAPIALEAPQDAVALPGEVELRPAERRRFFSRRRHGH